MPSLTAATTWRPGPAARARSWPGDRLLVDDVGGVVGVVPRLAETWT